MNTVTVIMSTYNGEKFLKEQLESIFQQDNIKLNVFVRDDGSTDATISILAEYKKNFSNFDFIENNQNLKPAYSFLQALKSCPFESDFYAFADQDDIWVSNKLEVACMALNKFPNNTPNLYCSTYDVVDKDLNLLFVRDLSIYGNLTMQSTLMGICPSGCTMVFNNQLKNIVSNSNPRYIRMHDFWTLLTVQSFGGNVIVDNNSYMKYRQHENNSVGFSNKVKLSYFVNLLKTMDNSRYAQAKSLLECYGEEIDAEKREKLNKLVAYRENLRNRCELFFDTSYKTKIQKYNILFKLSILLGVF